MLTDLWMVFLYNKTDANADRITPLLVFHAFCRWWKRVQKGILCNIESISWSIIFLGCLTERLMLSSIHIFTTVILYILAVTASCFSSSQGYWGPVKRAVTEICGEGAEALPAGTPAKEKINWRWCDFCKRRSRWDKGWNKEETVKLNLKYR